MSPASVPVSHVRLARQTDRLEACVAFYVQDLGFPELGRFDDHDGYTGVLIGLPDAGVHLELTRHAAGSPATPAGPDDLLVLYLPDAGALDDVVARLDRAGHAPVALENPYWDRHGARGFRDPDGRTVVLVPRPFA